MSPRWGLDTNTDRLTVRQLQNDLDFGFPDVQIRIWNTITVLYSVNVDYLQWPQLPKRLATWSPANGHGGLRRLEGEPDHSLATNADVKNTWRCSS
jgi:hypothetical protein